MKEYALVSPSLDGLLSDDALYFEGLSRPAAYYALRDQASEKDGLLLEQYWNDVYNLFLRKLSAFAGGGATDGDAVKLQALLQELIKTKDMLAGKTR